MLKPTNDPLKVMQRAAAEEARTMQAALDSGGTQPFQVVKKLQKQISDLEAFVNALPQMDGRQVNTSDWSIDTAPVGGPWTTIATANIARPSGKTRAVVQGIASASATTSNVYESAMQARLVINGVGSQPVEGAMENLAAIMRSTVQTAFIRDIVGLNASVTVQLQARGRYNEFLPSNVAALTVNVSFTSL